jgi:nitrogen fixation protein FixH
MNAVMSLVRNRWMFVPVVLLGCSVTLGTTVVLTAVARQPLGVEPQYDEKAAQWNERREQIATNDRLGWSITPEIVGNASGAARLTVTVKDKHAVPIPVEAMRVEAIPVRNADARANVELARVAEGRFEGDIPVHVGGQWEFRVTATRGDSTYTDSFRRTLRVAGRGER